MKFSRLDLLTLLISLFILNSCKNQNAIGLNASSTNQLSGNFVDTSTIVINTVPDTSTVDSIVTSGLTKNPLGYFNDPIFGTSQADLATDLNLPGATGFTLPAGKITIDSVRLVVHFADGFYGDSIESAYKLNVYQLNEKYIGSTTYYGNKKWNYNPNLLGTVTFNSRTHTPIKIYDIITGAPDTLISVPAQIRVPIDSAFIFNNLFTASTQTLNSNTIFKNTVNGLYLTIDKTKSTGAGGIFMISADTLAVYYKAVNGSTIDTSQAYLPITGMAAAITHTYTSAVKAAMVNTNSNNVFYVQGLAGLKAKISFPYLQNLRDSVAKNAGSDMLIDRAELVITPVPNALMPFSTTPFTPLPKISMYKLDLAGQPIVLQDAGSDVRSGGVSVFGGFYAPNKQNYHFIITAFIQDLLYKKALNSPTYIRAIDTTNTTSVDILPTPQVASRSVLVGTDKNSPYRIVLNIMYTKVPKGSIAVGQY